MTTTQVQGPAIHGQGPEKPYKQLHMIGGAIDVGSDRT
jgi:hypothetical protein